MEAAFWSADPTVVNIWSFLEKPASPAVPAPWHSSCVILGRLTDLVLFGFLTCKEPLWFAPRGVLVRNTWENPRRVLSAGPGTGNCAVILSTFFYVVTAVLGKCKVRLVYGLSDSHRVITNRI